MKKQSLFGSLILFSAALIWGVAFVFQRTGMDHVGPITFMSARCALAVIALGILVICVKGPKEAFKFNRATIMGGIGCGCFMTIANNLQQMGMVYTDAGKAGFITAMYILLVPVFGFIFFKRKESKTVWFAVLLGTFGMYLLCIKEGFSIAIGDIYIIGCAVFFSGHILCADKFAGKADALQMSFFQFVISFVLSTIIALLTEDYSFEGIYEARIAIAYCGLLSAGVGYTFQIIGQKMIKPAAASLIMSLESVFAVLSGWLFLNETMSTRELLGCIIMFAAILLVEVKPEEKNEDN